MFDFAKRCIRIVVVFLRSGALLNTNLVARFATWVRTVELYLEKHSCDLTVGPRRTNWTVRGSRPHAGIDVLTAVRRRVKHAGINSVASLELFITIYGR